MKILIPVMTLSRSGGFKVLTQLANYGETFGHQISFVCPHTTDEPYYDAKFTILKIDKKGEVLRGPTASVPEVKGIMKVIALWLFLRKNSSRYDAVIANRNLTAYPVFFGSQSVNFYYIQAYEPEFCNEYKNWVKRYALMLTAWLSYFLPLTKIVNAKIYKNYKNIKSQYVVPPGIDLQVFNSKNRRILSPGKEIVVGCIGRTEIWKGTADVTKAISLLHDENQKVHYKVAFNPVHYHNYELILPNGHHGLAEFYRSIDILVAPGHIQLGAAHYPVIEAMACGTLVITTGYYPADEENAYIVPVETPDSIVDAIKEIIDRPDISFLKSVKALEDVKELSWESVAKNFYTIIEEKLLIQ